MLSNIYATKEFVLKQGHSIRESYMIMSLALSSKLTIIKEVPGLGMMLWQLSTAARVIALWTNRMSEDGWQLESDRRARSRSAR